MKLFINLWGYTIPTYGLLISIGLIVANIIAYQIIKRNHYNWLDFIIIEAYALLGGFSGAKLLYIFVTVDNIGLEYLLDKAFLNQVMRGGFVFYGGLIGGLITVLVAGKVHHIDVMVYLDKLLFLIPLIHAFGRIGCFMAGCCYGKPYNGWGAVAFPANSYAPSDIFLFPVQLLEAIVLLMIAALLFWLVHYKNVSAPLGVYLVLYGIVRFLLEYLRFDTDRGYFGWFSTSQWISLVCVLVGVGILILNINVGRNV